MSQADVQWVFRIDGVKSGSAGRQREGRLTGPGTHVAIQRRQPASRSVVPTTVKFLIAQIWKFYGDCNHTKVNTELVSLFVFYGVFVHINVHFCLVSTLEPTDGCPQTTKAFNVHPSLCDDHPTNTRLLQPSVDFRVHVYYYTYRVVILSDKYRLIT